MSESSGPIVELLSRFSRAATARSLYPETHPSVASAVYDFLESLRQCLREKNTEAVTLLIIEKDVVIDDHPLRSQSIYLRPFVRLMNRFGIERLTLAQSLEVEESLRFLTALVSSEVIQSSDHLEIGQVTLAEGADAGSFGIKGMGPGASLEDSDLERGVESFKRIDSDRRGSLEALDKMIWKVMAGLADSTQKILLLAPIRNADQALFQHSLNVSTLAMVQGRSLGLEGSMLHEIGLAALLHDLGKTALPKKVWAEGGQRDGKAWQYLRLHPELGAALLSGESSAPPLAVLVAYEHHLRWDGQPSYPKASRRPNFASQITAVADTWDTFIGGRASLDSRRQTLALRGIKARSGTILDPFLVDNFITLMLEWQKTRLDEASSASPASSS